VGVFFYNQSRCIDDIIDFQKFILFCKKYNFEKSLKRN